MWIYKCIFPFAVDEHDEQEEEAADFVFRVATGPENCKVQRRIPFIIIFNSKFQKQIPIKMVSFLRVGRKFQAFMYVQVACATNFDHE